MLQNEIKTFKKTTNRYDFTDKTLLTLMPLWRVLSMDMLAADSVFL
jgi:hypothetical protein